MAIIEVDHVTKEFQLGQLQSLKTTTFNQFRRLAGKPTEERAPFKALDDISFSVEQGEVVGIIGHNGAGKSTLLKLLANISKPTIGTISVKGKVAPLIEVGAGLVADLTGRENIYLNGAILGIPKREIARKFDDIVAFAELEEFIDTPIKRYSSGMQVRLGFSIATSIVSDILIVDEVLAVGDLAFQRKCFDRIETLIRAEERTVLVVSHNLRQIERLCARVFMLDHGRLVADGAAREVCNQFFEASDIKIAEATKNSGAGRSHASDGSIELIGLSLLDESGRPTSQVLPDRPLTLKVQYAVRHTIEQPIFGIGIHTTDFIYLATEQSVGSLQVDQLQPGTYELEFRVRALPLLPGIYSFRLGVAAGNTGAAAFYAEGALQFQVASRLANRAWQSALGEGFFALDADWAVRPLAPSPDIANMVTHPTGLIA